MCYVVFILHDNLLPYSPLSLALIFLIFTWPTWVKTRFLKLQQNLTDFLLNFYLKLLCWCQSYLDSTVHFSIEYCYSHLTSIMKKKMFIRRKIITSSKASITQVSFIISKEFSSQMRMIFARPIIHNCTMVCEFWWVTSSFFSWGVLSYPFVNNESRPSPWISSEISVDARLKECLQSNFFLFIIIVIFYFHFVYVCTHKRSL